LESLWNLLPDKYQKVFFRKMSRFGELLGGKTPAPVPAPVVEAAPAPEPVVEKPVLEQLSKNDIEKLGRKRGIELDKRHSKKALIKELEDIG